MTMGSSNEHRLYLPSLISARLKFRMNRGIAIDSRPCISHKILRFPYGASIPCAQNDRDKFSINILHGIRTDVIERACPVHYNCAMFVVLSILRLELFALTRKLVASERRETDVLCFRHLHMAFDSIEVLQLVPLHSFTGQLSFP